MKIMQKIDALRDKYSQSVMSGLTERDDIREEWLNLMIKRFNQILADHDEFDPVPVSIRVKYSGETITALAIDDPEGYVIGLVDNEWRIISDYFTAQVYQILKDLDSLFVSGELDL